MDLTLDEVVYKFTGQSSLEWLRIGRNLFTASRILYRESEAGMTEMMVYLEKAGSCDDAWFPEAGTFLTARMLSGMAIENVLKGLILRADPTLISEKELKGINHHDLNSLLQKLPEIQTTIGERQVLAELYASIKWNGRFPIPRKQIDAKSPGEIKNEIEVVGQLYNRFKELLESFCVINSSPNA